MASWSGQVIGRITGSLRAILSFCVALAVVAALSLFVHELGHGLTAKALGGEFEGLYLWPGIQLWPNLGQPHQGKWSGYIGMAACGRGDERWSKNGWQYGLVALMGSGSNLVMAALALGGLWLFRPSGWLRRLLVAEALMFADLLLYVFLPMIGLRHLIFIGGDYAEPLQGALMLGFSAGPFRLLVALVSALMAWGLIAFARRAPTHE